MTQAIDLDGLNSRTVEHDIHPLFASRWSPRAMCPEPLPQGALEKIFEAARWAPSSYNEQEWRYTYALNGSSHWDTYLNFLVDANQVWCKSASCLLVLASSKVFSKNGKPNNSHQLGSGASMQNLLLQASHLGLVGHAMAGFEEEKIRSSLSIPEKYSIDCMIAIGNLGKLEDLPENLREIEKPSPRKSISEFTAEGKFPSE